MKCLIPKIFIALITPLITFSQNEKGIWLTNKFKSADTILLVSHKPNAGFTDQFSDKNGKQIMLPKLIIAGKPNRKIITEQKVISGKEIDELIGILARPFKDSISSQGGCFTPHQAIFIIKNGKTSYIDICFHCGSYETSKDLSGIPPFDMRRWKELKGYFIRHGFKYEIDKNEN